MVTPIIDPPVAVNDHLTMLHHCNDL